MRPEQAPEAQEFQEQMALALDLARMVAWTWDAKLDRVETQGDLAGIYGLPAVEFAEKGFSLIHADDVAAHRGRVNAAIAAAKPYHSEFRIVRPDNGRIVWIEERGLPLFDAAGTLHKLTGIVRDVTESHRLERVMDEAKTLLDLTFASLDQAVLVVEPATRTVISANAAVEAVFGYRPDELLQRNTELFYADHAQYVDVGERQRAAMNAGGAFHTEVEMRRKGGARFFAEVSVSEIRDPSGRRTGMVSVIRDISARRNAEQALQTAKEAAELAVHRTALLQHVTGALTPILPATDVAQIIVDQSAAALGASAAAVYLSEPDGPWLAIAGSTGYPPAVLQTVRRLPVDANLPGPDVFRTGEPMWLRSNGDLVARYPALANTRSATGNEALALIPLSIDGHRQGVLALSFSEAQAFEPATRSLLLTLARQCGQALERTRLYEAEQAARKQAERAADRLTRLQRVTALLARAPTAQAVAEVVIGQGGAGFGTASGAVFRLSEDGAALEMAGSYNVPPEVARHYQRLPLTAPAPAAEAAQERRPVLFASHAELAARYPAVDGTRDPLNQAHASVPLLLGDELAGVVAFSLVEEHVFDDEEQVYLMALGRQAAQALERIR
ncbi:MAG: PAS domain S-box protein, partial [Anaerolineales bacterium]